MRKRIIVAACVVACLCMVTFYHKERHAHATRNQNAPGFPFIVKMEHKIVVFGHALWVIDVIVLPRYYTRSNLERLFRYYSAKHPKHERLHVDVYTDEEDYMSKSRDAEAFTLSVPTELGVDQEDKEVTATTLGPARAYFLREPDGFAAPTEKAREWYLYRVNGSYEAFVLLDVEERPAGRPAM